MSNVIPPLVSTTPPPVLPEDDEDDDFGNFTAANDYYDDSLSLPTTPQRVNLMSPSTYQPTNLSVDIENLPGNELKTINSENDKDNTSQDSVPSFLTSDSGLSEVHSTFSDEVIHEKETINNSLNVDFHIEEKLNEKDFLDVRNTVLDISNEILDNTSHENDHSSFEENGCDDLESTVLNKDYKDKRKSDDLAIDTEEDQSEICKQTLDDEKITNNSCETEIKIPSDVPHSEETKQIQEISDIVIENNDFDDFQTFETTENTVSKINDQCDSEDDSEFTNFQSTDISAVAVDVDTNDDDFGDFANFQETTLEQQPSEASSEIEPFADFSNATIHHTEELNADQFDSEIVNLFSRKNVFVDKEKIKEMIKKVFDDAYPNVQQDPSQSSSDENISPELLKKCNLWDRLDDIENLKPLNYRWDMSSVYKKYLQVINIDIRNILYGSTLNMPRFVANLGGTPLEPLKPTPVEIKANENTTCTPSSNVTNSEQSAEKSSIQFDWSDSEFINTLESTMDKSETLKIEKDQILERVNLDMSSLNTFENQIMNSISKDTESVKSLNFTDLESLSNSETLTHNEDTNEISQDDTEFTDFHSSVPATSTNFSQMNLRETHISSTQPTSFNFNQIENEDKPAWLQPTVLTPELTRKTTNFTENKNDIVPIKDLTLDVPTTVDEIKSDPSPEEDDFTDFQFASDIKNPSIQTLPTAPVTPIPLNVNNTLLPISASPLEPIKLQSETKQKNVEINWPEPGISEDDLERLSNIRVNMPVNETKTTTLPVTQNNETKDSQNSDEDWSDFVCVSDPSTKVANCGPSNPLSSLPINNTLFNSFPPVTQDKLSVDLQNQNTLSNSLLFNQKPPETSIRGVPQGNSIPNRPSFPSQILLPGVEKSNYSKTPVLMPQVSNSTATFKPQNSSSTQNGTPSVNDDDWTDFVSNREPTNITTNNWNSKSTNELKINWFDPPNFTSWNAPTPFTPNIITNPTHFETYKHSSGDMMSNNNFTYQNQNTVKPLCVTTTNKNHTQTTLQTVKSKNSIATISSIPELDFMTPKGLMRSKNVKK